MNWFAIFVLIFLFGCIQAPVQNSSNESLNVSGEKNMKAEKGDTVEVMYLGKLENGTVFDTNIASEAALANLSNRHSEPLKFKVGAGEMISGFDDAVVGMSINEEKTITLLPSQAYGERRADLVVTTSTSNFDENISIGMQVQSAQGYVGTITKIENDMATIDFNPELAGKTLIFKIKLIKVEK